MANELRRRDIGIGGTTTDNPLTAGATSFNSTQLAVVAGGVPAGEYMAITLDPDQAAGAPEVAYITALTNGATTATILRGQEGTTARSHALGTTWRHTITPADVPLNPDIKWGGDLGYDYEFDADTTSLPSGWSWVNQGTLTYNEKYGRGALISPGSAGSSVRCITRAIPTQSSWTAMMKCQMMGPRTTTNPFSFGFTLRDSVSGKLQNYSLYANSGAADWVSFIEQWTNPTTFSATVTSLNVCTEGGLIYLGLRRNSATSYDFLIGDGWNFVPLVAANNPSAFITPDQLAIGGRFNSTPAIVCSVEWFRVR